MQQDFRRRGIASALYDAMEELARRTDGWCCEINSSHATTSRSRSTTIAATARSGICMQSNGKETGDDGEAAVTTAGAADELAVAVRRGDVGARTWPPRGSGWGSDRVAAGRAEVEMLVRDDMTNGHGDRPRRLHLRAGRLGVRVRLQLLQRAGGGAGMRHRVRRSGPRGDLLVAVAEERHTFGRNGIYDITVSCDDTVIAEFRGRSRTIGGRWSTDSRFVRLSAGTTEPVDSDESLGSGDGRDLATPDRAVGRVRASSIDGCGRCSSSAAADNALVYETVPHYRRAFDQAASRPTICDRSTDLRGFPFTSKHRSARQLPVRHVRRAARGDRPDPCVAAARPGAPTVVGYTAGRRRHVGRRGGPLDPRRRRPAAATRSTSPTATACSPAASARTTAPSGSAARSSRSAAG